MDNENTQEVSTPEPDSLRGDLEAAFDAVTSAPADSAPATEASVEGGTEPNDGRPRGPDGRFVKKEAEADGHGAPDADAEGKAAGAKAPSAPAAEPVVVKTAPVLPQDSAVLKPPASWKPAAREAWATLPPAVQAEIARREGDTTKVLNETTEARRFRETFQQTISPYEQFLRSEGADPMQAMASLLDTARQLKTAHPVQRAQLVAQIVKGYGVPIDALDAALAGQQYQGPAAYAPAPDPRVDQLFAQIEQAKAQRAQQEAAEADAAVQSFAADKEFFNDVREDMADIIEIAEKRGQKIDMETAYKRAIAMNEEISAVMRQREEAKAVANAKASTHRSRVASSSVKTAGPALKSEGRGGSIRDALEAAWEDAAG